MATANNKEGRLKHTLKGIASTREVFLDGQRLDPIRSQGIRNHSPDGFNWGYCGSGPAQLALAIMLELTGTPGNYQEFKYDVIAHLDGDFFITFDLDYQSYIIGPKLIPGRRGWHIADEDGNIIGKIVRYKGSDTRIVILRGTVKKIREVIESGLLKSL